MQEDKRRWNEKYQNAPMPSKPIAALDLVMDKLQEGDRALDIACGMGRHTNYLASKNIYVDAIDISDVALNKLDKSPYINAMDKDLDSFIIPKEQYDLILCTNFLSRRLFPFMKEGLKKGGYLLFETFVDIDHPEAHQNSNIEFHLRSNELLHAFLGLEILFYQEEVKRNLRGEVVKVATLLARRGC